MDIIEITRKALADKVVNRLWVLFDLQQSISEKAEYCLTNSKIIYFIESKI